MPQSLKTYTVDQRWQALLDKHPDLLKNAQANPLLFNQLKMIFVAGFGEAFDMIDFAGKTDASDEECMCFFERIKLEIVNFRADYLRQKRMN